MEEFRIMYKILTTLLAIEELEEVEGKWLVPERFKISHQKLGAVLMRLCHDGFITGVDTVAYIPDYRPNAVVTPRLAITIKGIEFLTTHPLMIKVAEISKGIGHT